MKLDQLLDSLTDAERNFIAGLDYGNDSERHREQLDVVIQSKGKVDFRSQLWFPYEVIELGRTLQAGHEREFAACWAIVLKNVAEGSDRMNDNQTGLRQLEGSKRPTGRTKTACALPLG